MQRVCLQVLLSCSLLLAQMYGCTVDGPTADDDDSQGDDDDTTADDDDTTADDDDSSAAVEFRTEININVLSMSYGDGSTTWQPGTQVELELEFSNLGPLDACNYPTVRLDLAASPAAVNPPAREDVFFCVLMDQPMLWTVTFEADENAAAQTVEFTASVAPMDPACGDDEYAPCYESDPLVFSVDIE
jgi:hypothetical protein